MATTLVLETKILPNDQFYLVNSIITDDQIKILESCKDLIEGIEINKDFSLGENETFQKFNDCLRNIEKILDNLNVDDDKKKIEIKEEISKLNDELSKLLGVKDKKEAGEDTQAVKIKPEHILDIDPPIICGSRKQVVQKLYVRVRKVAVKSISSGKQYVDGPEFIKLKEEIGFLKKLSELLYLISQWGEYNLKTILAERPGRLSWSEKLSISHGIANAIKFCHDQNILHYDLQSDNIFLDLHFQPKLYNFRTEKESPIILKSANDPVDERWSAPERLNGKEYTKASEIYSFAIVLWEIATNQLPFENITSKEELSTKIIIGERPTPRSVSGTPKKLQQMIEHGWCNRPNDRPTIEEMVPILDALDFAYIANKKVETVDDEIYLLLSADNSDRKSIISNASSIYDADIEYYMPTNLSDTEDQQQYKQRSKKQLNPFNKKNYDIQKAIQFHKDKSYKKAWKIFSDLEKNSSTPETKFWVGFYYYKGYHEGRDGRPNAKEATKYLCEAAKLDQIDAQYWYANMILNGSLVAKEQDNERFKVALEYLRHAAKLNHPLALRMLGGIIKKGQYGMKFDRSVGKDMVERSKSLYCSININKNNEDQNRIKSKIHRFSN
nr:15074_t:CDS:2 [Entrophospora candida]